MRLTFQPEYDYDHNPDSRFLSAFNVILNYSWVNSDIMFFCSRIIIFRTESTKLL